MTALRGTAQASAPSTQQARAHGHTLKTAEAQKARAEEKAKRAKAKANKKAAHKSAVKVRRVKKAEKEKVMAKGSRTLTSEADRKKGPSTNPSAALHLLKRKTESDAQIL